MKHFRRMKNYQPDFHLQLDNTSKKFCPTRAWDKAMVENWFNLLDITASIWSSRFFNFSTREFASLNAPLWLLEINFCKFSTTFSVKIFMEVLANVICVFFIICSTDLEPSMSSASANFCKVLSQSSRLFSICSAKFWNWEQTLILASIFSAMEFIWVFNGVHCFATSANRSLSLGAIFAEFNFWELINWQSAATSKTVNSRLNTVEPSTNFVCSP